QQQKQIEQTVQQTNQALANLQHEKLTFQQQHQQTNFENNSLKIQLDKLHTQHESINVRLTDALSELAKKTQDQQHWQERFQILQKKHDEQNKVLLEIQTQYAVLLQQAETIKA